MNGRKITFDNIAVYLTRVKSAEVTRTSTESQLPDIRARVKGDDYFITRTQEGAVFTTPVSLDEGLQKAILWAVENYFPGKK